MKKLVFILLFVSLFISGCAGQKKPVPTSEAFSNQVSTCYSIFPIAYLDSNQDNLGDLKGITSKLKTLKQDLNIDCIWINPIHPSQSYHKYDVDDYYAIDESFGTIEDYKNLIAVAHKHDIKVVMDLVINHSSLQNQLFLDYLAGKNNYYSSQKSTKEYTNDGWYTKDDTMYFGSFWEGMPEFNFDNNKVRSYFKDVAEFWINNGVDGFRIDAAFHIYDINEYDIEFDTHQANLDFFLDFNNHLKSINPDIFMVLEVWQNQDIVNDFYQSADSAFNFELSDTLIKSLTLNTPNYYADYLNSQFQTASLEHERIESNFLSNHDSNRIMSIVNSEQTAKFAANISLTLPGITWIYYGEELGMKGMKPDEDIREAYKWNETTTSWNDYKYNLDTPSYNQQKVNSKSILNHYTNLTTIRKNNNFSQAKVQNIKSDDKVLSYELVTDDTVYCVVHNFSESDFKYESSDIGKIIYGSKTIKSHESLIYSK